MTKKMTMTYSQAREELDTLVEALEQPNADLGQMAEKVKRAVELVAWCREYLRSVKEESDKILTPDET